ncbi:magnesium transporter [Aliidiomarina halalkaliphila]|uniref:Magnesium transporter MgtE n=1 Tax=Aliidiomarina halalkaliphila TaxID=2593535 RepID=A0A552X4N7_9GAMM|nr:magnesium transporter [Aliidiomarina halalkaliphila]TRW49926.1 magnesium transporter [Aliidiomarina halalkaliphila]
MLLTTSALEHYADEVSELLNARKPVEASRLAKHLSTRRIARILTEAEFSQVLLFLPELGWERAGRVARYMPAPFTARILNELDVDTAGTLLSNMPPQSIAQMLSLLNRKRSELLLSQFEPEFRSEVEQLLNHADGSAGSVMSPYFLSVSKDLTVGEAIAVVREAPSEIEATAYVYVIDENNKPIGVLSTRELLLTKHDVPISYAMHEDVLAVEVGDSAVDAARRIRTRRLKLLPVVSETKEIVGVITIDTAIELLEQEVADDFTAVSGASVDESFFTPPRQSIRMRLPWMMANVFLNLGAVWVISSFEATIVQVAILAAFLPMITDMGGNVGIQALSVSIRSMALGEARLRDITKALRKEIAIGIVNGIALGVLFGVIAFIFQGSLILSLVAGIALAMNVLVAGVVGGTMPFLIKRLGKDPAMMTGPVLTTITDITGVSIYLGLSTVFLAGLMASGL